MPTCQALFGQILFKTEFVQKQITFNSTQVFTFNENPHHPLPSPLRCSSNRPSRPPSASSIEAILSTNGAQQSLESTLAGVEGKMRQEINRQLFTHNNGPITPAQKLAVDKAAPQVTKVMQTEMGWDKMKAAYIKIYQDSLSQEEVNRLAALYKDPAYMALMQKMVAVNIKSAQAIQAKLPIIQQKIEPILEAAVKEAIGVK